MFEIDIPTFNEIYESVITILKNNQFAQGGMLISFLVALPRYIIPWFKAVWQRIRRLIIYTVTIEQLDDLYMYLEMWLKINHESKYRNVEAALKMDVNRDHGNVDIISGEYLNDLTEEVIFKQYNDLFFIRRGFTWIRVFKGREKLENASSLKNLHHNKFSMSGIFAKRAINNLIAEVHKDAQERMKLVRQKSIRVKTSTSYGDWIDENVIEPKKMENIILKDKDLLIADIDNFLSKKLWYKERDIIYKRGYLLYGKAGTGKTSFIISLAKKLNRTVHFLQPNRTDDSGIRNAFRNLQPNSMLVVEDIDGVFNQRDDGNEDIKFSFSTLLNCLDGVFSQEDIIVIFTTNHIEKLDPALIRSGRIDYKMEFELPSKEYVGKFLENFYKKNVTIPEDYKENLPMVDIQDACIRSKENVEEAVQHIMVTSENKHNTPVEKTKIILKKKGKKKGNKKNQNKKTKEIVLSSYGGEIGESPRRSS